MSHQLYLPEDCNVKMEAVSLLVVIFLVNIDESRSKS